MKTTGSICSYVTHIHAPIVGWLSIRVNDSALLSIDFVSKPSRPAKSANSISDLASKELLEYFQGERREFTVPLHFEKSTPWQRKVWAELTKIPFGQTRSYRRLAESLGCPGAARAVGSANGRNPIPIIIPCHRVIKSDGSLGGFYSGPMIKRALLELENIDLP